MVDLEYDPSTLLPPCPPERLQKFEKWLCWYWEAEVRLPQAYIDHIQRYHGGCPGKACFRTAAGKTRMVGRFFNFLEEADLSPPLKPTWRQWSGEPDVRLDYRVEGFLDYEFWCLRLERARHVIPIAGLDTAGHNCRDMDEIDLLCLDYNAGGEPAVVAWQFPGFAPVVAVASSFAVLLGQLSRCPEGVVSGQAENW
jgi:hypothetical protein